MEGDTSPPYFPGNTYLGDVGTVIVGGGLTPSTPGNALYYDPGAFFSVSSTGALPFFAAAGSESGVGSVGGFGGSGGLFGAEAGLGSVATGDDGLPSLPSLPGLPPFVGGTNPLLNSHMFGEIQSGPQPYMTTPSGLFGSNLGSYFGFLDRAHIPFRPNMPDFFGPPVVGNGILVFSGKWHGIDFGTTAAPVLPHAPTIEQPGLPLSPPINKGPVPSPGDINPLWFEPTGWPGGFFSAIQPAGARSSSPGIPGVSMPLNPRIPLWPDSSDYQFSQFPFFTADEP